MGRSRPSRQAREGSLHRRRPAHARLRPGGPGSVAKGWGEEGEKGGRREGLDNQRSQTERSARDEIMLPTLFASEQRIRDYAAESITPAACQAGGRTGYFRLRHLRRDDGGTRASAVQGHGLFSRLIPKAQFASHGAERRGSGGRHPLISLAGFCTQQGVSPKGRIGAPPLSVAGALDKY